MPIETYITFVLACIVLVIVPGPNVTVIIANSLRLGVRAGLASVAGTQLGIFVVLMVLAAGLQVIVAQLALVFDWIRLVGAAYLVWLGIRLLRSSGRLGDPDGGHGLPKGSSDWACFWQGCIVFLANPKALLFFGAFIPQFVDPAGNAFWQTIFLGLTFMAVAAIFDSVYAIAAGGARGWLTRSRVKAVERVSGLCMIGGGVWLALARR